jgi:hypothetical protein
VVALTKRHYQDPRGRLPLNPVDLDARWRTYRGRGSMLCYKEHIVVDRGGFILARQTSHSTLSDTKGVFPLLAHLPITPRTFCADTGYSTGELRRELGRRRITAYMPLQPRQGKEEGYLGRFAYAGDHVVCPEGKVLKRSSHYPGRDGWLYAAKVSDCQVCPQRQTCLPPKSKRKFLMVTDYLREFEDALIRNATRAFQRESRWRRCVAEGTFAHEDQLGWRRCRLRSRVKVNCEGGLTALAHNLLKAVGRLERSRPPLAMVQLIPGNITIPMTVATLT